MAALEHLQVSLELLDSAEAPAHIGAHIDLALNQLQEEAMRSSQDHAGLSISTAARH